MSTIFTKETKRPFFQMTSGWQKWQWGHVVHDDWHWHVMSTKMSAAQSQDHLTPQFGLIYQTCLTWLVWWEPTCINILDTDIPTLCMVGAATTELSYGHLILLLLLLWKLYYTTVDALVVVWYSAGFAIERLQVWTSAWATSHQDPLSLPSLRGR